TFFISSPSETPCDTRIVALGIVAEDLPAICDSALSPEAVALPEAFKAGASTVSSTGAGDAAWEGLLCTMIGSRALATGRGGLISAAKGLGTAELTGTGTGVLGTDEVVAGECCGVTSGATFWFEVRAGTGLL